MNDSSQIPINIYTNKIADSGYNDEYENIEQLKQWYYTTIKEFDLFWKNLINPTYIEE